jgi:hypothetical protein
VEKAVKSAIERGELLDYPAPSQEKRGVAKLIGDVLAER